VLLPVHVGGARLSAGFADNPGDGWIDVRLHLTKRGMTRFHIDVPLVLPLTTGTLERTRWVDSSRTTGMIQAG
jgi:formamidase